MGDITVGWTWEAALDELHPPPCAACVAMDGSEHDLAEEMDSHSGCRCQAVPLLASESSAFPDGLEAQDTFLEQEQSDALDSLTDAERESIREYTYLNYRDINASLRDPASLDASDRQWIADEIAKLDSAIAKGVVPADMTIYRGIEAYGGTLDFFQENIGNVISDNAFISTTLNGERASMFADDGAMISILVPKGYSGLYISPLSEFDQGGAIATPEYEFLLPRDTKFRIMSYTPATDMAKAQFIFEVVP